MVWSGHSGKNSVFSMKSHFNTITNNTTESIHTPYPHPQRTSTCVQTLCINQLISTERLKIGDPVMVVGRCAASQPLQDKVQLIWLLVATELETTGSLGPGGGRSSER